MTIYGLWMMPRNAPLVTFALSALESSRLGTKTCDPTTPLALSLSKV
jgi:hypothetical protein